MPGSSLGYVLQLLFGKNNKISNKSTTSDPQKIWLDLFVYVAFYNILLYKYINTLNLIQTKITPLNFIFTL